jgi:hypothetical protein
MASLICIRGPSWPFFTFGPRRRVYVYRDFGGKFPYPTHLELESTDRRHADRARTSSAGSVISLVSRTDTDGQVSPPPALQCGPEPGHQSREHQARSCTLHHHLSRLHPAGGSCRFGCIALCTVRQSWWRRGQPAAVLAECFYLDIFLLRRPKNFMTL